MLEQWNAGFKGIGATVHWKIFMNGPIPINPPTHYGGLKPIFHYSTIPFFHVRGNNSCFKEKILIFNKLQDFQNI
jgi:hypothetical protein